MEIANYYDISKKLTLDCMISCSKYTLLRLFLVYWLTKADIKSAYLSSVAFLQSASC